MQELDQWEHYLETAAGHPAVHDVLSLDVRRRVEAGHEVRPENILKILK